MGAVDFDKVETGGTGAGGGSGVVGNHLLDVGQAGGAGGAGGGADGAALFIAQRGARVDGRGRGGNRRLAAGLQALVRHQAGVPQLHCDFAAACMHGLYDFSPGGLLCIGVQAGGAGIAFGLERYLGGFGDD